MDQENNIDREIKDLSDQISLKETQVRALVSQLENLELKKFLDNPDWSKTEWKIEDLCFVCYKSFSLAKVNFPTSFLFKKDLNFEIYISDNKITFCQKSYPVEPYSLFLSRVLDFLKSKNAKVFLDSKNLKSLKLETSKLQDYFESLEVVSQKEKYVRIKLKLTID